MLNPHTFSGEPLLPAIITEACLDKDFSYAIFDNPFLGEIWKKQVSLLNEEQLFYVLRKKYVSFDYMNSKVANRFLHYYMEDDSEFNYGLFIKSLEDSEDEVLKAMASAKCIAAASDVYKRQDIRSWLMLCIQSSI